MNRCRSCLSSTTENKMQNRDVLITKNKIMLIHKTLCLSEIISIRTTRGEKKVNNKCEDHSFFDESKGRQNIRMRSIIAICFVLFLNTIEFIIGQETSFACDVQPSQANTTEKLQNLRVHLTNNNLFAYVIFSADEHNSEYVQLYDERRAWITGFLGSAGTAVVTRDRAALWTDGRYWTQAEDELDCKNWYLMRQGQSGVPSFTSWLASQVNGTAPYNRVGVAAQFATSSSWSSIDNAVSAKGATLVEVTDELIDFIWLPPERPLARANPVFVHHLNYSGITWQKKVEIIAGLIQARRTNGFVVTALDEIAWLFSLRGSDIPYNPFFKVVDSFSFFLSIKTSLFVQAYAIVYANQTAQLWMNQSQLTADAMQQLAGVSIRLYASFPSDLLSIANRPEISTLWITSSASQAIFSRIPTGKRFISSKINCEISSKN